MTGWNETTVKLIGYQSVLDNILTAFTNTTTTLNNINNKTY